MIRLRNLLVIVVLLLFSTSCDSKEDNLIEDNLEEWVCGEHNGHVLYTGPRGGCYYYNSNENKTYVDRSECDC
ncbi:hypothetical protein [Tenacibaculum sp. MAR_2009_124]|uniref:hypothetical protein n=1 Tax=Tenacibaculum sp. MAR_2009_124 TaxID=1250059 RepID=UPI00115FA8EA|nr:hypothetical protein [Tenacibaculum sp. MAR_2009_124]